MRHLVWSFSGVKLPLRRCLAVFPITKYGVCSWVLKDGERPPRHDNALDAGRGWRLNLGRGTDSAGCFVYGYGEWGAELRVDIVLVHPHMGRLEHGGIEEAANMLQTHISAQSRWCTHACLMLHGIDQKVENAPKVSSSQRSTPPCPIIPQNTTSTIGTGSSLVFVEA